eukprot:764705-Hanusia_phi.AAC.1
MHTQTSGGRCICKQTQVSCHPATVIARRRNKGQGTGDRQSRGMIRACSISGTVSTVPRCQRTAARR